MLLLSGLIKIWMVLYSYCGDHMLRKKEPRSIRYDLHSTRTMLTGGVLDRESFR